MGKGTSVEKNDKKRSVNISSKKKKKGKKKGAKKTEKKGFA